MPVLRFLVHQSHQIRPEPPPNDAGLATGLRGSTADIAAYRERGPLPVSSPRTFPQEEPHAATAHVSQGRCPETSCMPRPMMILAGERQPGKQVSPIREQN